MPPVSKKILRSIVPLLIVLGIWEVAAQMVMGIRGVPFPTPWQTFLRLGGLTGGDSLCGHSLYVHIGNSLRRWAIGFTIAAFLGIGYGLVAGRIRAVEKATAGIPQLLLLIPGLAWVPVAILLFGIGETATVFMIVVSATAPIAINVLGGIKDIDVQLVRAARMMGAGNNALFFRVLIPAALPSLISGLRIGLGTGWRVLVAAEMVVGTGTGLGYSIVQARWTLDYPASFACIAVICGIGLLAEQGILRPLEKQAHTRWTLATE
ncbi:ABC transporter permease [Desulfosarcina ovata]|uniref:Taurine ABC transporter permease n=1 Tax=Desulfosarcina ovata subsp. ovata TaxID=2752305 RepID=A0A5K8A7Q9_9BACT|nr:ABC transporter permease [Desulfosarcina ovata]BBO88662.1 taurine ABC transporter permease [Desulfosarcina ovata subsp. ovata]